jgi:hypothetical protein
LYANYWAAWAASELAKYQKPMTEAEKEYERRKWRLRQYKMEPLKKQIGGEHYTVRAIQPIEYINANRMGFCEGNVIKYVTRYKEKDGKKDLEKAIHYLQLLIQMEYGDTEQAKEIAVGVSWSDEILRKEQEKLKRDEDTAAKYGVVYHETYTPT